MLSLEPKAFRNAVLVAPTDGSSKPGDLYMVPDALMYGQPRASLGALGSAFMRCPQGTDVSEKH